MTSERDLDLPDGRTLHVYDDGAQAGEATLTVVWHHGTPQTGGLPEPLRSFVEERLIRWLSYDRPGYAGSTRHAGRRVADAASDVLAMVDSLGVEEFVSVSHSGGGAPALATAALHPERVSAVVSISGIGPTDIPDWYDGMAAAGEAELRASDSGEDALREFLANNDFDPELFTAADHETLAGEWSWLDSVVNKALEHGVDGMVDDDLSYVNNWGFDPSAITVPVLFLHGTDDRIIPPAHSRWLADRIAGSELELIPDEGHLSILRHMRQALDSVINRTV